MLTYDGIFFDSIVISDNREMNYRQVADPRNMGQPMVDSYGQPSWLMGNAVYARLGTLSVTLIVSAGFPSLFM